VFAPAAQAVEHVVFRAVSEHGEGEEEAHRPQRHRRRERTEGAPAELALEMVETRGGSPAAAAPEEELPRRTKPRRRRGGAGASEPLKLVETKESGQAPDATGPQ
jgi:hypothetical protein